MNNDLRPINTLPNFKRFCMTIGELPTSYLETMTYYEMLVWFTEYMKNTIIPTINNNGLAVEELQNKYIELKSYVDDYFTNLDVQEEINNKLDQMVQDGTLSEIISSYLNSRAIFGYNNIDEMKQSNNLINGSYARTLGYYNKNDNGEGLYKITNILPTSYYETLNNGLYAELIIENNEIKPEQFGAKGDATTDDTDAIQNCINYAINNYINIRFSKRYLVNPKIDDICLKIDGKSSDHLNNNNIEINFDGNALIFTNSNTNCTLIRFNCGKVLINNLNLKGVREKTTLFDMARINSLSTTETSKNSYNVINKFNLQNAKIGLNLEGATYYNTFNDGHIKDCDNGIIIGFTKAEKAGLKQDSACNRNNFNNITIIGCTNGIELNYADTTKFVNINFEGVENGIKLDDPSKHKSDFPIEPLYFTNDNMFVNITFEQVTRQFNNNATGTKVINTSTKYKKEDWTIEPQIYSGGTDIEYSLEKYGRIYKNLQSQTAYGSSQPYATFDDSPKGFESKTIFDYIINDNIVTNLINQTFTFELKTDSNINDTTYDKCYVKSIGGIDFISGKLKIKPINNTQNIKLYFPSDKPWITNITGSFSNVNALTIPIAVGIIDDTFITYARIKTDCIEIIPPNGHTWSDGKYNDIYINLTMFRDRNLN